MSFDTSHLESSPQQILSLCPEQYSTIFRLYRSQKRDGADNVALKRALNALTYDVINNHAESMCNLSVIGHAPCTEAVSISSAGGYGIIMKVSRVLPTPVAVKYLRGMNNGEQRLCLRWVRESRIWKEMEHPNIVPLLGIWIDFAHRSRSPLPAFVMPLMDTNLKSYLIDTEEGRNAPVRIRIKWLCEVLAAVAYMHNHKFRVVHGDLCAANILLKGRTAYVCDFGLSRTLDGIAGFTTSSKRRDDWIAPERYFPDPANPTSESDMYEYGITFLEVTTGRTPWDGLKDRKLKRKRFYGTTFGTPTRPPGIPDVVWEFVQNCTRIDVTERTTSSKALLIVQGFVTSGIDWPVAP